MLKIASLIVALLLWNVGFAEQEVSGKIVSVVDGNTFELVADNGESYKIVLYGIDAPELGQEFGDQAQKFLQKIIIDKKAQVKIQGKDRWGNNVGILLMEGNVDPRTELLKAGLAWTTERNPIQEFESIKETARAKGKGLWKQQDPTPPWTYRRDQTMLEAKAR